MKFYTVLTDCIEPLPFNSKPNLLACIPRSHVFEETIGWEY